VAGSLKRGDPERPEDQVSPLLRRYYVFTQSGFPKFSFPAHIFLNSHSPKKSKVGKGGIE